ncbi:hypothetical protein PP175_25590 (plasmid) [Aneurinibacillus sp. Ricciae_BoGa-3]|uniref:hypothetical protein n=1 Tax=Aneurinibacillus sp. Ricciae_BoGa-3 TaxID=3022697 RepID=UPI002341FB05|nr:hypothetical protein [Aneurinibacillus sp. Ricciae_BoGa-3]WCK57443.1 hypothetical protein PP175_25590 [Aneurinibacillus sp. Ricciae_BoGa-3]
MSEVKLLRGIIPESLVCPDCKKDKMYYTGESIVQLDEKGMRGAYLVFRCLNRKEECDSNDRRWIYYPDDKRIELMNKGIVAK